MSVELAGIEEQTEHSKAHGGLAFAERLRSEPRREQEEALLEIGLREEAV